MNLYEIDNQILDCIDKDTGEVIDVERLQELQLERDKKIENVALWYKNLLSDAEQLKAEKDAFAKREKIAKNKAESLKAYLDSALCGGNYKTTRVTISYRSSEAVVIDDIYKLDENFVKYSEPTADKDAIKKAIKAGLEIEGAHIESRSNISIK